MPVAGDRTDFDTPWRRQGFFTGPAAFAEWGELMPGPGLLGRQRGTVADAFVLPALEAPGTILSLHRLWSTSEACLTTR